MYQDQERLNTSDKDLNPFISLIIPVYNAENYLKKCINSILQQNNSSFEVICINDGSKDQSLEILKTYESKDKRFKVITKKNEGPAAARNLGLSEAKGQYLWFIDADDWIVPDAIQVIFQNVTQKEPDILGFGAYTYNNVTKNMDLETSRNLYLVPKSHLNEQHSIKTAGHYLFDLPVEAWSRIYKTKFIKENKINFYEKAWGVDDGIFVAECFLRATKVKNIKNPLYNYRIFNNSSIVYELMKVKEKTYKNSILFANKCDEIIQSTNTNINTTSKLIDRNLFRIYTYFNKANILYKYKMFYLIKKYLIESPVATKHIQNNKSRYQVFYNYVNYSFFNFMARRFLYSKRYYFFTYYRKVSIFGIEVYRKSEKKVNSKTIRKIRILGLFQIKLNIKKGKVI